jgi:hypothetical protein
MMVGRMGIEPMNHSIKSRVLYQVNYREPESGYRSTRAGFGELHGTSILCVDPRNHLAGRAGRVLFLDDVVAVAEAW